MLIVCIKRYFGECYKFLTIALPPLFVFINILILDAVYGVEIHFHTRSFDVLFD